MEIRVHSWYCWKAIDEGFLGADFVICRHKVWEILNFEKFCHWKLNKMIYFNENWMSYLI
jgi:hypothetical protein